MGKVVKQGEETYYVQDDGEITARLTDFEEKMELSHGSDQKYKWVFYVLVTIGFIYLALAIFVHGGGH